MHVPRRGLYSLVDWNHYRMGNYQGKPCRGLYSLVDWNTTILAYIMFCITVEAYTASWIEITDGFRFGGRRNGRGLYSLVDWNLSAVPEPYSSRVEAYTASWIEILWTGVHSVWHLSRLIQPRGLKSIWSDQISKTFLSRLIQPRGLKWSAAKEAGLPWRSRLIQPRGLKWGACLP